MKISIVTVCLNSAETIESTIQSVLSQRYEDVEYIVVDGGSTDDTLQILARYRDRITKCISKPDEGIYEAMNRGISVAEGHVIGFLNADDIYADETVVQEVMTLMNGRRLDAVYGDVVYILGNNGRKIIRRWQAGKYKRGAFFYGWVPPHPSFFCRKHLFEHYGFFKASYRVAADFELMLRFMEKHRISVGYLPKSLVRMRMGGKANRFWGIIRGNLEIIDAFRANGFGFPFRFLFLKPFLKMSQFGLGRVCVEEKVD